MPIIIKRLIWIKFNCKSFKQIDNLNKNKLTLNRANLNSKF